MSLRDLQEIFNSGQIGRIKQIPDTVPVDAMDLVNLKFIQEGGGPVDSIQLKPQTVPPAQVPGVLFFDEDSDSLAFYPTVAGPTANIPYEFWARVVNGTGATLEDGLAVHMSGVDASGYPTVELALASDTHTAIVYGITTADIAPGEFGIITKAGLVNGINTAGFATGDYLFLSSTIPGRLTNIAPDFTSRVGQCVKVGADGSVDVFIDNLMALPPLFGIMTGANDVYVLDALVWDPIVNYESASSVGVLADIVAGTLTCSYGGFWRVTGNLSFTIGALTQSREVFVQVYNQTQATGYTVSVPIARDVEAAAASFAVPVEFNDGDVVILRLQASTGLTISITQLTFDIEAMQITRGQG